MPGARKFKVVSQIKDAREQSHGRDFEENEQDKSEEVVAETFERGMALSFAFCS